MKNNTIIIYVSILTVVAIVFTLGNTHHIDLLRDAIENIEARMNGRNGLHNNLDAILLTDLLNIINQSGLHPDSVRFLVDFVHTHLQNLPTEDEINRLIEVLREVERKLASSESGASRSIGDYINKYTDRGPGPSGGSAGTPVN